jgi:hypothetical protein
VQAQTDDTDAGPGKRIVGMQISHEHVLDELEAAVGSITDLKASDLDYDDDM